MGGFGSGRTWDLATRKRTVDYAKSITIQWLKEKGYLDRNKSGSLSWRNCSGDILGTIRMTSCITVPDKLGILFDYRIIWSEGRSKVFEYFVRLSQTPCFYGGQRHWFRCPLCYRRTLELFLPGNKELLGCRLCYNLTYESCLNSHKKGVIPDFDSLDFDRLSLTQMSRLWDAEY